jgi:hypothetical protein
MNARQAGDDETMSQKAKEVSIFFKLFDSRNNNNLPVEPKK